MLTKRLETGTFACSQRASPPKTTKLKLTPQALAMLTDGVDLRGAANCVRGMNARTKKIISKSLNLRPRCLVADSATMNAAAALPSELFRVA